MNVAFLFSLQNVLSLRKPLQYREEMAFGISYISAMLKNHGHSTRLFVAVRETRAEDVRKFIEEFSPCVICFTSVASEFSFISRWAKTIKEMCPHIYLVVGGPHVSLNPEDALREAFDAVCIGEGEYPILELVEQIENGRNPSGIANLWIKKEGGVEKNVPRPFIADLDILPFPDRAMWNEWVADPGSRPVVFLGRGCSYQCTYCSNHALSKLARGHYVRFRSVQNILSEIKELLKENPATDEIYFEIETFGIDMDWAIKLCRALGDYNKTLSGPLSFGVNIRVTPNIDFEPLFAAMHQANFRFINIGLESGSERIRREVMKRNYSNDDIVRTVELARRYGLQVHFLNMLGLPEETEEDIKETIRCNRVCQPDLWASHTIFFPYPGTDIYRLCREKGFLPDHIDAERERSRPVLDLPGLSKGKVKHYYDWFDYYVYRGHRPLVKILPRVLVNKLHSSYRLMRLYRSLTEYGPLKKVKEVIKQ